MDDYWRQQYEKLSSVLRDYLQVTRTVSYTLELALSDGDIAKAKQRLGVIIQANIEVAKLYQEYGTRKSCAECGNSFVPFRGEQEHCGLRCYMEE